MDVWFERLPYWRCRFQKATTSDDRDALVELMGLYATMLDTKDWALATAIFTDPLTWDFESAGWPVADLSIAALSQSLQTGFSRFKATHHAITNHRITIDGDRAHVRTHIHAQHWVQAGLVDPEHSHCWVVIAFYDDDAVRTRDGWRLQRVKLTLRHQSGQHVLQASVSEGDESRL